MSSKKKIIITGGAGFVGTNLIKLLLKKTKYNIISIDNYSSGKKTNHIKNSRVKYLKGETANISKLLKNPKNIKSLFHFGEFARIYQSFFHMNECINSNSVGSNAVLILFKNRIKLIYSATSASLEIKEMIDLSPYAFTKPKFRIIRKFKKWFKFKYEVIYFYNVYGPNQISKGKMSTIIGIFEDHYKRGRLLPVVRPGTQSRRFTHILDTVEVCYLAWKKNLCRHYSIANKKSYSINEVAKMFKSKIKYLPRRAGERYVSALTNTNLSNKIHKNFGKINLKDYIRDFINNNSQ